MAPGNFYFTEQADRAKDIIAIIITIDSAIGLAQGDAALALG